LALANGNGQLCAHLLGRSVKGLLLLNYFSFSLFRCRINSSNLSFTHLVYLSS